MNNVYNTDHGNFRILASKKDALLDAINAEDPENNEEKFESLEEAFAHNDLEFSENDAGDIIDVFISASWLSDDQWKWLQETVGPFVEPGSFLVFAFGEANGVWGVHFKEWKTSDPGVVKGGGCDIECVVDEDLERMLVALQSLAALEELMDPSRRDNARKLYLEMRDRYATPQMRRSLERGSSRKGASVDPNEALRVMRAASFPPMDRLADHTKALDEWIMKGGFLPDEWAKNANGGLLTRALLGLEVYKTVIDATESIEGDIGMFLAYLLGAILQGDEVDFHMDVIEEVETLGLFEDMFPPGHPVWKYVQKV